MLILVTKRRLCSGSCSLLADRNRLGLKSGCLAHYLLNLVAKPCCPHSRDANNCQMFSFRKEVIQPQVLLRLPCYDFTPIMNYTLGGCSLAVSAPTSSATHFRDVTGGVYKARERIHRSMLICDY